MTSSPFDSESTQRSLGELVASASADLSSIVRDEIELAKAEVTEGVKPIGAGLAMFAVAAFVALLGLIYLIHSGAQGLVEAGLREWLAYLIVAVVLFLTAGLLALAGRAAIKGAKPTPERAIAEAKDTIATLKAAG